MSRHTIVVLRNLLRTLILCNNESSVTIQKDFKVIHSTQFVPTEKEHDQNQQQGNTVEILEVSHAFANDKIKH
jgi:hypothetical protein